MATNELIERCKVAYGQSIMDNDGIELFSVSIIRAVLREALTGIGQEELDAVQDGIAELRDNATACDAQAEMWGSRPGAQKYRQRSADATASADRLTRLADALEAMIGATK
jgi:dsRNA-specific ribonuclease